MSQSLSQQWVHIIFSTKDRFSYFVNQTILEKLHRYIHGICANQKCNPSYIGGIENHVHILVNINKKISLSTLIEEIKKSSSRWIKELKHLNHDLSTFQWQRGYAAFSVSTSNVEIVKTYILHQKKHHQKRSFQEELRSFLEKHQVEYNEKYLWE